MRGVLGLVSSGVPWDIAASLDTLHMQAWSIIIGELKSGERFDFDTMSWPKG